MRRNSAHPSIRHLRACKKSEAQPEGSVGLPEGSEGLSEGSEALPKGLESLSERSEGQPYGQNFSSFYRTLSSIGTPALLPSMTSQH